MKKIILFGAAGLLATATIVTATVSGSKKAEAKKETVKKDSKCTKGAKKSCSGYWKTT